MVINVQMALAFPESYSSTTKRLIKHRKSFLTLDIPYVNFSLPDVCDAQTKHLLVKGIRYAVISPN